MRKTLIIVLSVLFGVLIFAPIIVAIFSPWSEINCVHHEINIKTGQTRSYRCFWYMELTKEVRDTALSKVLRGEVVDVDEISPWHRTNTFSPGVNHSPHYSFHSAMGNIYIFMRIQEMPNLDSDQELHVARELLKVWQQSGGDHAAGEYLNEVHSKLVKGIEVKSN